MSSSIRTLISVAAILMIVSCSTNNKDHITTVSQTDTNVQLIVRDSAQPQTPRTRNQMTDSMLAQIIRYYQKEYGNDSIQMDLSRSDTVIEVSFRNNTDDSDEYTGTLFIAYISLVTDIGPIVSGDMSGDGRNDLLVSVHTEGGGGGGNAWWSDHFLFLSGPDNGYILADIESDGALIGGAGYFFPKEISNQLITGTSNEYDESDGHCCPSLYYRMQVRLTNGRMIAVSKAAIAKPAEFE